MTGNDELPGWGITRSELERAAIELRMKKGQKRDQRICVCGHPMTRHSDYAGRVSCSPTRMACPCGAAIPVIDVSDTRPFLRKTHGPAQDHALTMGLSGLIEKGRTWKWVDGMPICMKCERKDAPLLPYAFNRFGKVSYEPERDNLLLCSDCAVSERRPRLSVGGESDS